jgi:hypothetical protein
MLAIYSSVAFTVTGAVPTAAANATVEVRREDTGVLATIYSDEAGTLPITQPGFAADANGRFEFYAAGLERGYQITVTKDAFTYTLNNQAVGVAAQFDATTYTGTLLAAASKEAARVVLDMPQVSAPGANLEGGYLDWTVSGNVLTVAVKTWAGNDPSATEPVYITFRSDTAATGSMTRRKLTAATSIAINNTALLGTINTTAFRLWCVAFDDGGTVRLGVINCLATATTVPNIYPLAGFGIASSTQEADGADSAHVFYTDAAAVTSKAYAVLGYATWETGLATAGTWSAGPTRKQLFGPGVPMPGAEIQRVIDVDSTQRTTTSGTFVTTELALSITPNSAANLIELEASTSAYVEATTDVNAAGEFQIARGAATGTSLALRRIFIQGDGSAFNWAATSVMHLLAHDTNQPGATTYTVGMRDSTGVAANIRAQDGTTTGIFVARELMT